MSAAENNSVLNVALVSEQSALVRMLSGFRKKNHTVPDECNYRTQAFVGKLAYEEIAADLDSRFAQFRKDLGFKRLDLKVSEPDSGLGAISTPWFDYRITITQASDDPQSAVFRRQVSDFRDTKAMLSSEFATVFGTLFNSVEFEPPEPIDIEAFIDSLEDRGDSDLTLEFDRTSTWCQIATPRIPGTLSVETDCIALITAQPELPARLLEAFFSFREHLTGIDCF
jgi:hypothetical protein